MKKSTVLKILLVIIVVALAAFGVFYFTNKDRKRRNAYKRTF